MLNLDIGAQLCKYVLGWVVHLAQEDTDVFYQRHFEEEPYRILTPKKDRAQSAICHGSKSVRESVRWDASEHTTPSVLTLSVSFRDKSCFDTHLNISPLGVSSTSSWNKIGLGNVEHYFPCSSPVIGLLVIWITI